MSVADEIWSGLAAGTWKAVITVEPDLDVVLTGGELDTAFAAEANFADVKSPYTWAIVAVAELAEAAARMAGLVEATRCWREGPGMSMTSAGSASPTPSGTNRATSPSPNGNACDCTRT